MAKDITKKPRFGMANSEALEEIERISETGRQQRKERKENEDGATKPSVERPANKKNNGIVVDVPMEDYMSLMQMKVMTRRSLKDLALQAIHEFVERNK